MRRLKGEYMLAEKIDLYKYYGLKRPEGGAGYLYSYIPSPMPCYPGRLRPAMLVLGGGGYAYVSERETECVALQFLAKGFCAFTLDYSVAPVRYPAQLNEAAMAMAYIRENAGKFGTDAAHVAVIGFSAGGHLLGCISTLWDDPAIREKFGEDCALVRPDASVYSYAVISSDEEIWHRGSFVNFCKDKVPFESYSIEKKVRPSCSPAFIWSTTADDGVPVLNSVRLYEAYVKAGVPAEMHLFREGGHGLSTCDREVLGEVFPACGHIRNWISLSVGFLEGLGFRVR